MEDGSEKTFQGITEPKQSRARLSFKWAELPVQNTSFGKHNYTTFTQFYIKSLVPVDIRSILSPPYIML